MSDEVKEIIKEIECFQNEEVCLIVLSQKENKALLNYITNLQQRIDKAIEYIQNNKEKQYGYNYEYGLTDKNIDDLLNILQGSDKE